MNEIVSGLKQRLHVLFCQSNFNFISMISLKHVRTNVWVR